MASWAGFLVFLMPLNKLFITPIALLLKNVRIDSWLYVRGVDNAQR